MSLAPKSLEMSKIPVDWKTATITHIYKKGPKLKLVNYRPVGLISICSNDMKRLSDDKFNSSCGWPAFSKVAGASGADDSQTSVQQHADNSLGMKRVEVTCKSMTNPSLLPIGRQMQYNQQISCVLLLRQVSCSQTLNNSVLSLLTSGPPFTLTWTALTLLRYPFGFQTLIYSVFSNLPVRLSYCFIQYS